VVAAFLTNIGLCMGHKQCLVEDNVAGVSHAASGIDKGVKNGRGCWMVVEKAYIKHSRLKLFLVIAWCNHSAGAAKDRQCMQSGEYLCQFIWRGIVSVGLGRSDVDYMGH